MGSGSWDRSTFISYSASTKYGATLDTTTGMLKGVSSHQDIYKSHSLNEALDPLNVMRECCDTDEHPNTKPVILALDVTGSMGDAAVEVAKSLNVIMEDLYKQVQDVEFCVMGIGDLYCDRAPIQISQFESDVRIAEHMDKVYFEFGGGGNNYESYTAAWYMGLNHTKLDCWNRGQKGIIITIGDETLNPYLPKDALRRLTGDKLQADVDTKQLYKDAANKFDIYHIHVDHDGWSKNRAGNTFSDVIGKDHFFVSNLNSLPRTITDIIIGAVGHPESLVVQDSDGISW